MKDTFLFQLWPYLASLTCATGLLVCFAADRPIERRSSLTCSSKLFHVSFLLLLCGHLGGLVSPSQILAWNSVHLQLYTLEATGFVIGLTAFVGCVMIMRRHLELSSGTLGAHAGDAAFMSFLFVALVTGTLTAVIYRWGSSWGVLTLTPYIRSLLRGTPAVGLAAQMPFLVRLHVFSAFGTMLLLPFSPLAPVLVFPLRRGLNRVWHPVSVWRERAWRLLGPAMRELNPMVWLWPEED